MKTAKILIVDAERSIRQALLFEFEEDGYEVEGASEYEEAINALHAFKFDMVITDVNQYCKEATCFLDLLKQDKHNTAIIFTSAFPGSKLAIEARKMSEASFYEKPFFMPAFKEQVQELLNK